MRILSRQAKQGKDNEMKTKMIAGLPLRITWSSSGTRQETMTRRARTYEACYYTTSRYDVV